MMHRIMLLVPVVALAWAGPAAGEILNDWQFDDPPFTMLNAVSNSAPGSTLAFAGETPRWETDGNGLLVNTSFINHFRNADIANVVSGQTYLRVEFAAWHFNPDVFDPAGPEHIGVVFRDADAELNLVQVRAMRITNDTVSLRILDDVGTTVIQDYPAQDFTNGLDVILGVDLDRHGYEVYYREGDQPFAFGGAGPVNPALTADLLRFQSQYNFGASGEFMSVDRLYHGETLEDMGLSGFPNDWTFDDPPGTELDAVANVGLQGADWGGAGSPGLATDGTGRLVDTSALDHFRQAAISPIAAGGGYLRMDVAAWDFPPGTGGDDGEQIGFGFRDSSVPANLVLAKLVRRTNDTAVVLRAVDDAGIADLAAFPIRNFTDGLSVVLAVDLDEDTYEIYYRVGEDVPFTLGGTGAIGATNVADQVRFQSQYDFSTGGEFIAVDRIVQGRTLAELGVINEVTYTAVVAEDAVGLVFTTEPGVVYRLERSDNGPGNWVFTGTRVEGTGGAVTLHDPDGFSPAAAYRIVTDAAEP